MSLRQFAGGAKPTKASGDFSAAATSFTVDDATGWPDGSVGPFTIVVNRTGATAEKMLATARTGTIPASITVPLPNRGYDGTSAAAHFTGETVEHVATAEDMRDANAHIFDTTTDAHLQYMRSDGTRHDLTARHGAGVVDHGSIGGLSDDDHPNNLHVSAARSLNDPIWTPVAVGDSVLVFKSLAGQTAAVTRWLDSASVLRAEMDADFDFFAKTLRAFGDDNSLLVLDRDNAASRKALIRFRQQGSTKWSMGQDADASNLFVLYDEVDGQHQLYITEYGIGLLGMQADFGTGRGVLGLKNADDAPTVNPTTGSLLYSILQVFKIRDSEGTKTPFGREIVDAKGDLIVASAADAVARLAVGADLTVLEADTTAANGVKWGSAPVKASLVDAKGDLLVGTADNTVARLAVGANNKALTADSSQSSGLAYVYRDRTPKRQGGSSTDWHIDGTTNYDLAAVDVITQVGVATIGGTGTFTTTFPVAFSAVPVVTACPRGSAGIFSGGNWYVVSETTTKFDLQTGNANIPQITWIATGPA